jgi:isoleucyl-tRNA synthetase
VRTSRATDRLVRHNGAVRWVPEHLRDGRFGNFLTEAKDWALSRNRYWGTPLPIWVCPDGHATCVGSFAELAERLGAPLPEPFDPHRVSVDRLAVRCATCGRPSRREPYTIDAWYDSGSAPFAQYHHPFAPGPFAPERPLDFVAEGLDQTRGWFYSLLVIATLLFDRPAYTTCLTSGLVLDESGRKMSKSKGNAIEPLALLGRFGADPVRWTFLSIDFTESMRIGEATVQRASARTMGTLLNVVAFHLESARADRSAPPTGRPLVRGALDRWLLSRLEGTRAEVEAGLSGYAIGAAATAVRAFVDDLSTWYLRRSRPRLRGEGDAGDRRAAQATLSYALVGFARTLGPLLPFTAEWIYQEVGRYGYASAGSSVHLAGWPEPFAERDPGLEEGMQEIRALVEIGRELRQRAGVKSRVPLAELVVFGEAGPRTLGEEGTALLAAELNVRRVVRLPAGDRSQYPEPEWVVREDGGVLRAALPRRPTGELREEGLAREVARRLQQRRKELGLRYAEKVSIEISATGELGAALEARRELLARELLADPLRLRAEPLGSDPDVASWEFEGLSFSARVRRRTG